MKKRIITLLTFLATIVAGAWSQEKIGNYWYALNKDNHTAAFTYKYNWQDEQHGYSGQVNIPPTVKFEDVTYTVTSIVGSSLRYSTRITGLSIPKTLTGIDDWTFDGFDSPVTSITVADGNPVFDSRNGCNAIIRKEDNTLVRGCQTTVIPASVTAIGPRAFAYIRNMTSFTIPSTITAIGESAFRDTGLETITIPSTVKEVGLGAFQNSQLKSFSWPSSLAKIPETCFANTQLEGELVIPNSVTFIGSHAFTKCTKLTSVSIPPSVYAVASQAFSDCNGLKAVKISDLDAWCNIDFDTSWEGNNPLLYAHHLYVNGKLLTEYTCTKGYTEQHSFAIGGMPGQAFVVKPRTFEGCTDLTKVTINLPAGSYGGAIGDNAFDGCINLKDVTLNARIPYIKWKAFGNCTALKYLQLPSSLIWIGENAFYDAGLKEIVIPEGVQYLYRSCFWKCKQLERTTLPTSLISIYYNAFEECTSLWEVTLPDQLKEIMGNTFRNCTGLRKVTLPASLEKWGQGAFEGCTGLRFVVSKQQEPLPIPLSYESFNVYHNYVFYWYDYNTSTYNSLLPNMWAYVPRGTREKYAAAQGWQDFARIIEEGENVPTAIGVLDNMAISSSDDCYDMQGRKVSNSQVKKGIYISNGRKMVIK